MKTLLTAMVSMAIFVIGPLPLSAQVQGQWTSTGSMQSARELNAQLPLAGGKALAIGGVDNSGNVLATAETYNPTTGVWTLTGPMAAARAHFAAVALKDGRILVSGGLGAASAVLGGAELYDPVAGTWSSAGALKTARFGHTETLLKNGKVLVTGGCTIATCATYAPVSEIYDPVANSWTPTGALNTARVDHTAVLLPNGQVMAIGGYANGDSASCELYNATTGKWTPAASTHDARYLNGTTQLHDGDVLVTGGVYGRFPGGSAEVYSPTTGLWTLTGTLKTARYAHTSTLLPDGTVLVAGGEGQSISCGKDCTGYIPTAAAEIYNEATGAFTATTALKRALAYHSTTLTTKGDALTAGGQGYAATCCTVVSDAEYYTPLTLSFSSYRLDFGVLRTGLTSAPQTVTVTNLSGHSSTFSGITAGGDYAQTNSCPATLAAGQQCAITVTFRPTKAGLLVGAISVKDNDPGNPTQTIALTGTGETLSLGLTPASLNLGSVAVGSSISQSATLTNAGSAPLTVSGITVIPANGTFTQTNTCPATLAVQQTCTITVVFTPPDVFPYTATVSIANSAGKPATLPVSGAGLDGGGP